jgi:gamma-glutamylaminecyclotransferase
MPSVFVRVFVYGTLKRGFENHRLLENSVFVGEARTVTPYSMLDGAFPVLRDRGEHCFQVSGELYEVDEPTLALLDELEDTASGLYERVEADAVLTGQPGETCKAFIYVGCAAYWDYRPATFYAKVDARGYLAWKPDDENRS